MKAGNAYHRVKFYPKTITRDDYSASVDTFDMFTIDTRGEIRYTSGSRVLETGEKFHSMNVELIVRYRSDIVDTMKVQIDNTNDLWNITFINRLGRNESLKLTIEKATDSLTLLTDDAGLVLTGDDDYNLTDDSDNLIMQ